ncbi:transcription initiation factor TFIIE subunit alpha [Nematocida displodere]|uniref:Transcription initiation factor TFIIE subunit alpha n=1 Tax=Nematocida displodere TaxID=1805483 RepID=A0A177EKQ7_9MICR|nr:transcription initiation factor TFIIE subunit alpha [Nematocida displodere]
MEEVRRSVGALVQRIVRMFYEPHHAVIMDIMLHHLVLDEEDLADKMKMLPREFNRLAVKLRDDKILSSETLSDIKDDGRQVTTTKFFLDFRTIRDVVKYKIYTMTQRLEKKLRENENTLGFGCPKCGVAYSVLDAQSFLSMEDFTFRCPECREELVEQKGEDATEKEQASGTFSQMMEEISPIIVQLKEIDSIGMPEMSRGKIILALPIGETKNPASEPSLMDSPTLAHFESPVRPGPKKRSDILLGTEEGSLEHSSNSPEAAEDANSINELLSVCGAPKKFGDITEADKETMTELEYERYFEVFEQYNK